MRLPYLSTYLEGNSPEAAAIIQETQVRRGLDGLLEIDRTLLYSTPITHGWNVFYGAIRTELSIPVDIRELAICRVSVLTRTPYEWRHHAPLARTAGLSDAAMELIQSLDLNGRSDDRSLTSQQWAVVRYTDEMTLKVSVQRYLVEGLKKFFSNQEIVELTMTVSLSWAILLTISQLGLGFTLTWHSERLRHTTVQVDSSQH